MKINENSLTSIMTDICRNLNDEVINTYYVGGFVRDSFLGIRPKDIDICITSTSGIQYVQDKLERLKSSGIIDNITSVHGSFPIWIIEKNGRKYEFAMARRERKIAEGHQGFVCETDFVTIEEDLSRRDFTINAIAVHSTKLVFIDPFNGISDVLSGIIRHVSPAFEEDVLRVYRAARFAARFAFEIHKDTLALMMLMRPKASEISMERVGIELKKTFEYAKPSKFFRILDETGWLTHAFKELYDLKYIPQDEEHHPEGNAFEHTLLTIDAAYDPFTRIVMLCHDLGKNGTTYFNKKGKLTCPSHPEQDVLYTDTLLKRIKYADWKTISQIKCLVKLHMLHVDITEKTIRKALRELLHVKLTYKHLVDVMNADIRGRAKVVIQSPNYKQEFAQMLIDTGAMVPIVTGKKLLELGIEPSQKMGTIIETALKWQDRGTLNVDNWQKMIKPLL